MWYFFTSERDWTVVVRGALNVIFDVGRQAPPGSRRLCLRQLREQTGYIRGANWYGQLLVALSCWFVQHVNHASFSSAELTVTFTGLQQGTSLLQCPLCRFQPSVQKVVRIYEGGGEMFPVSGRNGYTLSSVQFMFLSTFSSKETNRQLQAAAFQSSFSCSDSILQMRKCSEIYFLDSNHWVGILGFQRNGKLQLFCRTHV